MHSQIVCRGCRTLLLYPAGATNVQCLACSTRTPVYPRVDAAPLMYNRGATSVRCACCHSVTPVTRGITRQLLKKQHISCELCHCPITLMFPHGAPSVRCSRCNFVTNINSGAGLIPIAGPRFTEIEQVPPTTTQASAQANSMTVVVENPMPLDEEGKLVSNVAVGIATGKK